MVLRKVEVEGYKCFRNRVVVGPFGDGLNMIFGPNETGKSTLVEAAARALFERHRAGGEELEALRPWEAPGLTPRILLQFEATRDRYSLEKRLLSQPAATLQRFEGGRWVNFSQGDEVDDWLRELMHADAPGRGPSRPEHWGLARALWVLQVRAARDLQVPDAVCRQIRAVLPGTAVGGSGFERALQAVETDYRTYFTEKGRPRSGAESPFKPLDDRLDRPKQKMLEARAEYERAIEAASQLKALEHDLLDLEEERTKITEDIERHRQASNALEGLRGDVKRLKHEVNTAAEPLQKANSNLDRYDRFTRKTGELQAQLEKLKRELDDAQIGRAAAEQNEAALKDELDAAEEAWTNADQTWQRGDKIGKALHLREEIQQIEGKQKRLISLAEELATAQHKLAMMQAPKDADVQQARQLEAVIASLRAQLQAVGLRLEAKLERDQEVIFRGDSRAEERTGRVGEALSWNAGAAATLHFPGVASVDIRSGAAEPADLEDQLRQASEELADLLGRFEADDAEGLSKMQLAHSKAKEKVDQLRADLKRSADPYAGREQLDTALAEKRGNLDKVLRGLGLDDDGLAATEQPELDSLAQQRDQAQAKRRESAGRLERCRKKLQEYREQERVLAQNQAELEQRAKVEKAKADQVLESAGCRSRDDLGQQVGQRKQELQDREYELQVRENELPAPENDPEQLLSTAKEALKDAEAHRDRFTQQIAVLRDRLEDAQRAGRYEVIAELEEEVAEQNRELQGLQRRAYAAKLLRDLMRHHQHTAIAPALPGLELGIDRMMLAITGRHRAVSLSSEFAVSAITEGRSQVEHDASSLSGGTREQLELVVRIALGEAYAKEYGGTMMVLDDALLYTDPYRHERVKEILKRAAEKLQVLLLTSHPERYRGIVAQEHQFDLAAIVRDSLAT